jgi:hypothetical protein
MNKDERETHTKRTREKEKKAPSEQNASLSSWCLKGLLVSLDLFGAHHQLAHTRVFALVFSQHKHDVVHSNFPTAHFRGLTTHVLNPLKQQIIHSFNLFFFFSFKKKKKQLTPKYFLSPSSDPVHLA